MATRQQTRQEVLREATYRRAYAAKLARTNVNVFCEFVLKDEFTGDPIIQAPMHEAWHRLLDDHDRLLLWAHVEAGKSQQVAIGRTLFELGRDPSLRWLYLGNTRPAAQKLARVLRKYIESSDELHDVFPDLQPGEPWGEQSFSVQRPNAAKDPTVQTAGNHGDILGSRLDRVLADDVLDYENTRTQTARRDLINWWPTVTGRLTDDARVRVLGNAFHPEDLYHWLGGQSGWKALRYPVHVAGVSRWPERWPWARIEAKARELGPIESQRQLMCEARDDSTARFPRSAIDLALRLGDGTQLCSALTVVPNGYKVYTGVDLAVQMKDTSDTTCLFTIAVDPYGVRSPLSIERGRWPGPEIVRRIIDNHRRFQSIVWVENNAAQDFIRQWVNSKDAIPIHGFTTGRNKAHPEFGVEHIATEMSQGKWKIPNDGGKLHPLVRQWVDEMLFYSPEAHTGDALMASWFAREGAFKGSMHVGQVTGLNLTRR